MKIESMVPNYQTLGEKRNEQKEEKKKKDKA